MSIPAPLYDLDLDKLFQITVAGITDLDGALVRPRFQSPPPKRPSAVTNWCALGVTEIGPSGGGPYIQGNPLDDQTVVLWRHEQLSVLVSFYGPSSAGYASRLRDGISIPQNMEMLEANQIYLVEYDAALTRAPELLSTQWIQRYDLTLIFNRKVIRLYPIQRFSVANIHLFDDHPVDATFFDTIIKVPPTSE